MCLLKLWKSLNAGMVPANKEYAAGTLSNVHRCWLAMPRVAGFLEMFAGVLYNREKNESLICTPPPHRQTIFNNF